MADEHEAPAEDFDVEGAILENLIGKDAAAEAQTGNDTRTEKEREDNVKAPEAAAEGEAEADPDDAEVSWKDGESETKAKLRELKEAFKERTKFEAEFKRANETTQKAEVEFSRANSALTRAISKAQENYAPFAEIDWLALSRDPSIDAATFQAIRTDAQSALAEVQFYTQELDGLRQQATQQAQAGRQQAVQASIKALTDPTTGIPGFGKELYGEIMEHSAGKYGAPREALLAITDQWAIRALHDAMQFQKAQAKGAETTAKVEKVINKATKVLTGKTGSTPNTASPEVSRRSALDRQRDAGGDLDSTADAILASLRG
jgi:copper(I)-binding protein